MSRLPEPLEQTVLRLAELPGLGPKSALRAAIALLKMPRERAEGLGRSILTLLEELTFCSRCHSLCDADPCPICADAGRDDDTLCVVGEWDSLLAMEEGGFYTGRYFVLGGLVAPLEGMEADKLEFTALTRRLAEGQVREVILALGTTFEAEATASHVKRLIERDFPHVGVTRLAQGIPLGSEVKHIDRETLRQSLIHRQKL